MVKVKKYLFMHKLRIVANTATSNNFVWRNFPGIEENPNGQKSFLGDTGPSIEANFANSPLDHFNLFIENVMETFCIETNRYANQNSVAGFQEVGLEEMLAFVAMNIAMGMVNTSDVKDFWSTDPILSHPWFPSVMSNQSNPGNDKLFKVRPLLDHMFHLMNY